MRLIECRCTNCNAPLMIDEYAEFYTCEYCDEIIHRDLSDETPSEATGKMLAKKVSKYREDLTKLETLEKRCQNLQDSIYSERRKNSYVEWQQDTATGCIEVSAVGFVIIIAGLIFGISNIFNDKLGVGIIAITVALVAGLLLMALKENKNTTTNNIQEIQNTDYDKNNRVDSLKKQLEKTEKELEMLKNTFDINYIPEKYRSQDALKYIIDVLDCGRAYSMKEAYNLYENHLDKQKIYQMQQQNLETQNKLIQQNNQAKTVENIANTAATVVSVASVVSLLDDIFGD